MKISRVSLGRFDVAVVRNSAVVCDHTITEGCQVHQIVARKYVATTTGNSYCTSARCRNDHGILLSRREEGKRDARILHTLVTHRVRSRSYQNGCVRDCIGGTRPLVYPSVQRVPGKNYSSRFSARRHWIGSECVFYY